MYIQPLNIKYNAAFKADKKNENSPYDKNPIKVSGERINMLKATAVAGLGVGARALFYLFNETSMGEELIEKGIKIAKKNKDREKIKPIMYIGAIAAVLAGFIGAVAAIYTVYNTPKALYDAKVNTFKKGKDMDVYIRGNAVEKELYNQMNDKAKDADAQEKERLKLQYAKLQAAKNTVPDFVKVK